MTAIRLEPTETGAVWRHGYLRLPSGNAVLLSLVPQDWDALERLLVAAENGRLVKEPTP
jgi:hypothetical protein